MISRELEAAVNGVLVLCVSQEVTLNKAGGVVGSCWNPP